MRAMLAILVISILAGCGTEAPGPDAAPVYGAHDQVTACDPRWSSDGVAPAFCDHGCAVRPQALPCNELERPCAHTDSPCPRATSPSGSPVSCSATIDVDGARGCCVLRATPAAIVPTFFECSPSP